MELAGPLLGRCPLGSSWVPPLSLGLRTQTPPPKPRLNAARSSDLHVLSPLRDDSGHEGLRPA